MTKNTSKDVLGNPSETAPSKSAVIRNLYFNEGLKVGPIARQVGVSYQRAYNTVKAAELKAVEPATGEADAGTENGTTS